MPRLKQGNHHNQRQQSERFGRWAETWVSILLWCRFYRRLHHRYRNPYGEIDLIFTKGRRLVFIEVKYRSSINPHDQFYDDIEKTMPHPAQRKRLMTAANVFIQTHPEFDQNDIQFDLVIVYPWGRVRWITNGIET